MVEQNPADFGSGGGGTDAADTGDAASDGGTETTAESDSDTTDGAFREAVGEASGVSVPNPSPERDGAQQTRRAGSTPTPETGPASEPSPAPADTGTRTQPAAETTQQRPSGTSATTGAFESATQEASGVSTPGGRGAQPPQRVSAASIQDPPQAQRLDERGVFTHERRRAAAAFDDRYPDVDIGRDDVVATGDEGFELRRGARERVTARQFNEQFSGPREAVEQEFGETTIARDLPRGQETLDRPDIDVTREEVRLSEDGATLAGEARREFAADQLDRDLLAVDVTADDLAEGPTGDLRLSDDLRGALAAQQLDERFSGPRNAVEQEFGETTIARDLPRGQDRLDRPDVDIGRDDVSVGSGGAVFLDRETQQAIQAQEIAADLREQGEDVTAADVTVVGDEVRVDRDVPDSVPAASITRQREGDPLAGARDGVDAERIREDPIGAFLDQAAQEDEVAVDQPLGGGLRVGADEGVAERLTGGGALFGSGTEPLDEPGQIDVPQQIEQGTSPDDLERIVARRNPGLDRGDVTVDREGGEFQLDVSQEGFREFIAAANPGVDAGDVEFDEDGEPIRETGGFDPLAGDFIPTRRELQGASQTFQTGVGVAADIATLPGAALDSTRQAGQEFVAGDPLEGVSEIIEPFGGIIDESVEASAELDDPSATDQIAAGFGATIEGSGEVTGTNRNIERGAVSGLGMVVNAPAWALTADTAATVTTGLVEEGIDDPTATATTASILGGAAAVEAGESVAEAVEERPAETGGMFAGALLGGTAVATATSPIRLSRARIPLEQTRQVDVDVETQRLAEGVPQSSPTVSTSVTEGAGTTTATGVRVTTPPVVERLGVRARGRTVAGATGTRPQLGAPSLARQAVDDNLDLSRLGTTGTATAEPRSAFEADVFRATTRDVDEIAGRRFVSAERIQRQALNQDADFSVDSAEEALGMAQAVPDDAVGDVADALRDTDATVFGSAAARAQVENFRQPRDIDIVIEDKSEAMPRLERALEGENADVGEVFDIKEIEDVPGRARGGETIKFGRSSREPRELGGIEFNPAEEELVRKAGASAFVREPDAAGTPDFDVGPEPRRPGRPDVREKDVLDTQMLAEELGVSARARRDFEDAFDLERTAPEPFAPIRDVPERLGQQVRAFAADERAQLGARPRGRVDTEVEDTAVSRADLDIDDGARRVRTAEQESPPVRALDESEMGVFGAPSPTGGASPGGVGSPGFAPVPSGSPGSPADATSPDVGGLPGSPAAPPAETDVPPVSPIDEPAPSPGEVGVPESPMFDAPSPGETPLPESPAFNIPSPPETSVPESNIPSNPFIPNRTVPQPDPEPQRTPRRRDSDDPDDRRPVEGDERLPETPLFVNPIADVWPPENDAGLFR